MFRRAVYALVAVQVVAHVYDTQAPRVALYFGNGTSSDSAGNYSLALTLALEAGAISGFSAMSAQQLDDGLDPTLYDVLIVPGGMSTTESAAVGIAGRNAIKAFVAAGKGYVGTCAGAYLAITAECCDRALPNTTYCGGKTGCYDDAWALGFVKFASANPWARGHGYVNVTFSDAAVAMLQLPATYRESNVSIMYWQGPIADKAYNNSGFDVLATYRSEIHTGWPAWTTGQMVGTPAIIASTFGLGRVLLSSPHPEMTSPLLLDLIIAYVRWAAGVI